MVYRISFALAYAFNGNALVNILPSSLNVAVWKFILDAFVVDSRVVIMLTVDGLPGERMIKMKTDFK